MALKAVRAYIVFVNDQNTSQATLDNQITNGTNKLIAAGFTVDQIDSSTEQDAVILRFGNRTNVQADVATVRAQGAF